MKTSTKIKMAVFPMLPLTGNIIFHYMPDWIRPEIMTISSILAIFMLGFSIVIEEDNK